VWVAEPELLVDPAVSRAKFEREIANYRQLEQEYIQRGWWLVRAEFPQVFVVFGAPQLKPPAVVFGALLEFTNYDLWPPSVLLVDPFTRVPYKMNELPSPLPRAMLPVPGEGEGSGMPVEVQVQTLMQAYNEEDVPFLCLPGVREYHEHPAHTGDPWLRHRRSGEGTLHFLLEQLYRYGVQPINRYGVQLQVRITGFAQEEVPT
jgi:hypothetical protein